MQPLCASGKTTICIANVLPQRMHFMNETNTTTQHVRVAFNSAPCTLESCLIQNKKKVKCAKTNAIVWN